jgi:hypothetical protein
MRQLEEILSDYETAIKDAEMCQKSKNCYGYKNQELRDSLQLEADELLPLNKKLAIYLHKNLCHYNHTDMCGWYYEIHGIIHDWDAYTHKQYLNMSVNMLNITNDVRIIKGIIESQIK